jgi:hypothetical protein
MTHAGCPMNQSAVWKIENGKPRRRITVDEAVAFASVFKIRVEDLIVDVDVALGREVDDYFRRTARISADLFDLGQRASALLTGLESVRNLVIHTGAWDEWAVEAVDGWKQQLEAMEGSRSKLTKAMNSALAASAERPGLLPAEEVVDSTQDDAEVVRGYGVTHLEQQLKHGGPRSHHSQRRVR